MEMQSSAVARDLSETDFLRFCAEVFPDEPLADVYENEARFGLSRLLPILSSMNRDDLDVLEVGGGSCVLSAYLASKKLRVTAVEPLGSEFGFFSDLQRRVLDYCHGQGIPLSIVRAKGEALNLPEQFDLAFTINALEHMQDPLRTIDNMCDSLKPGGVALLHCPNYTIPFEAHVHIWLVTRSKRLNEWLYRSKIDRRRRIWDELTFIRYVDVRRHLAGRGAHFTFNGSVARDMVVRLVDDPIFAQRMPSIVRAMGAMLRSIGLIQGLTLLPVHFQTPMEVLITNTESGASSSLKQT